MPSRRMTKTGRMIEHAHGHRLRADLALIAHPVRSLPPDFLFSMRARGVDHVRPRSAQLPCEADPEAAFFRVAKHEGTCGRGQREFAIDYAHCAFAAKMEGLPFLSNLSLRRVAQAEVRCHSVCLCLDI